MKIKYVFLLPALLFYFSFINVFSATLQLQKIGALDLGGKTYSEWWYTGVKPVLSGVAEANSTVTVTIDDADYTAAADSAGKWSYSSQLTAGDYDITVAQGSDTYSFKLHLGQSLPSSGSSETTQSTTSVPETGMNQTVAISFGLGIALLATYLYVWGDNNKKVSFQKILLQED